MAELPEKILLLGAWHEARGGTAPWRSADMDDVFGLAKESPPSNFPRDIKNAIKSGWIHNETPRTYIVTRTGWNKNRASSQRIAVMSPLRAEIRYRVLPLPRVQREAKKLLTSQQLAEGIALAKRLRFYPDVPDLSIEPCGDAMELRLESKSVDRQGWLRAMFYTHEASRTIYLVDLFWKKTNKVTVADFHRVNHRIRQLKSLLLAGGNPWRSGE